MDLNYLKKLLKIVNDSGIDEVEIEEEGSKIRVKKSPSMPENSSPSFLPYPMPPHPINIGSSALPQAEAQQKIEVAETKIEEIKEKIYHEIKSPIVGTFYRAPSPDAEPYVKVGDSVSTGTVLCIVEAMKLMNEIECDVAGKVIKILVENGKPVEYGQVLFLIETS